MFSSFAIVGSGAIGLNYGVRLALAGADVRFLVRGDPAPLRVNGLRVIEKARTLELRPAAVFARPEEIGPVGVVLVALKTTANAELPRLLPPLVGPDTLVVTLQNGLGNEEFLAGIVGGDRVLGGICFVASTRTGPGTWISPWTRVKSSLARLAQATSGKSTRPCSCTRNWAWSRSQRLRSKLAR